MLDFWNKSFSLSHSKYMFMNPQTSPLKLFTPVSSFIVTFYEISEYFGSFLLQISFLMQDLPFHLHLPAQ